MEKQSEELVAAVDESELKVFVRSSAQELELGELDRVAGGGGTCIVPWG